MDKLQLTGQNLGQVFYFRYGHVRAVHFLSLGVKLPNLKLKTRPKQLLGSLPLGIALHAFSHFPMYVLLIFFNQTLLNEPEILSDNQAIYCMKDSIRLTCFKNVWKGRTI
jgi:hypothetical protein